MAVHEITPLDGDLADLLHKTLTNRLRSGYIKVDGYILPQDYAQYVDAIENFEVRNDDIWVCGFPKTGTTWAQEMVWSICNDLDFEKGKIPIDERFPFFERSIMHNKAKLIESSPAGIKPANFILDSLNYAANMPSPRFIKTHLPADLLPLQLRSGEKTPKVIYIRRDPKDTCISFYHFSKLLMGLQESFEDFYTLFLGDTDSFYFGPFWKSVLSFWNKRSDFNMLLLTYEDMKENLPSIIRKTATFLGKNLTTDQVSLLTEHLSFSSMKGNSAVNHDDAVLHAKTVLQTDFEGEAMRSGTTGRWKHEMTPEVNQRFDDWTNEKLNGTGLSL